MPRHAGASFLAQKFYKCSDPSINHHFKAHSVDLVQIFHKNILTNSNSFSSSASK